MQFTDFLTMTRLVRSLYGSKAARTYFEENIEKYKNIVDFDVEKAKSYLHLS